ncbi:MAG TPA: MarR family winged helix-turn-helix transcriptional regulator [Symbiobacteriaceae bacterium]|nr:MarR family winged helix-turn-helix transcriptional regulator [Symbiobacteriaceae bacterium]
MTDPRVAVGEIWRDVNRTIHERFRQAWRGTDLYPGAMFLLRHLQAEPGLTVSELSRRAGLVKSGVSKLIDQADRMGLVEKRPDPADQRLQRLFLTEQGTVTMTEMESKGQATWLAIIKQISPADLAEVEKGLRILQEAVVAAANATPKGDERS